MHVLDCTLRDGGYYCNWDFDDGVVQRYLDAVTLSGIDLVELGFRSTNVSGFAGKFQYSKDSVLQSALAGRDLRVAVMIEAKDFEKDNEAAGVRSLFAPAAESPVAMVRVAASYAGLERGVAAASAAHDLGYVTTLNLMQGSLLSTEQVESAVRRIEDSPVDVFYVADSFGGMTPPETRRLFGNLRERCSRPLGFHGHDNLGLALMNSVAALEGGAEYVDCSFLGMGRGAGNLRTEQLLLYLKKGGETRFDPSALFDVASTEFSTLQLRHQWGPNLAYMLSGLYNLHPLYAQNLFAMGRYTGLEVVRTMEVLHDSGSGASFSPERLAGALEAMHEKLNDMVEIAAFDHCRPGLPLGELDPTRPVLILGSGHSVRARASDINQLIERVKPVVIECNMQEAIDPGACQLAAFINHRRLSEHAAALAARQRVVLGPAKIPRVVAGPLASKEIYHYPYRVTPGSFTVRSDGCSIPFDVVAMYAFSVALALGARTIYACGFDGYDAGPSADSFDAATMQFEMATFFELLRRSLWMQEQGVHVVSLTPTTYPIEQGSLYALL